MKRNWLDKQDKNSFLDVHETLMSYAEVSEFFKQVEKTYSSGWTMYCRGHNINNRRIYQVFSEEFIDEIAEIINRKLSETGEGNLVLEVMAGDGKLSEFLRPRIKGVLITTDSMEWETIKYPDFIEELSAEDAINKYNPDIIIMCWEPYGSRLGVNLAKEGRALIWIGEGSGGCCGGFDYEYENDPSGVHCGSKYTLARTDYTWGELERNYHTDIILFNFGDEYKK